MPNSPAWLLRTLSVSVSRTLPSLDSLLRKYLPELWDLPTTNGQHSTGDGHTIAISTGASAVDMEKVQMHPTGLVDPKEPKAEAKLLAAEVLRGVGARQ
ncbi:hypothetical protein EI94DRAFT_962090 [Lactarius quietus]|nr:hypothetical protein EI94DRAFT_962090 [Lactarius quietus]